MFRTLLLAVLSATLLATPAHAGQIEKSVRDVKHVHVVYAEPFPTKVHPNRQYFELNDGRTFIYKGTGACLRDNRVRDQICVTVFWYAR